jgi:hypothetical protein
MQVVCQWIFRGGVGPPYSGWRPDPLVGECLTRLVLAEGQTPSTLDLETLDPAAGPTPSVVRGLSNLILAKGKTPSTLDLGALDLAVGPTPLLVND